ncbi:PAAR domain-containing protein [Massilia sp. TS11]|uniref:PAAR domain-containing protein n=1 Tax=Massilia sp. TS11 TaxID=2908003 RepID=UPI001EDB9BC5|nr:PAAR domain-containing protein [Massilia sp. TS11]MCG2586809.1 PAAR domain-containing protein [Massilia sp. TS11]
MRRHTITLGAKTTAGGKVIVASSKISINGVGVALEGDDVFCPACKATGKIRADGPRLPETFNGATVALEGDLCMCGCLKPPRLIAIQAKRSQDLDTEEAVGWDGAATIRAADKVREDASGEKGDPDKSLTLQAVFVSEKTERPLEGARYASANAVKERTGTADSQGRGEV